MAGGLSNSRWATGRYRFNSCTTTTTTTARSASTAFPGLEPPRTLIRSGITNGSNGTLSNPSIDVPYHLDFQSALNRVPTPWSELSRYAKIARRLKWKIPFLAIGYNAATDRGSTEQQRAEAEINFQLDFFEYYMLIERALVHLLGVFGVKITGAFGTRHLENRNTEQRREHRFHSNVLEALDDHRNPLYEALGKDDARFALGRAKELRNRWKNADEPDPLLAPKNGRNALPLEEYDLERVLDSIFAGFDRGFQVAEEYVAQVRAFAAKRGVSHNEDLDMDQPDEWGFMTDAMDWEAV